MLDDANRLFYIVIFSVMPTDIGRLFKAWKLLYELARILIEYESVNVKIKKIMTIVKHSLIIYSIAGINAVLLLPAFACNLILSVWY